MKTHYVNGLLMFVRLSLSEGFLTYEVERVFSLIFRCTCIFMASLYAY